MREVKMYPKAKRVLKGFRLTRVENSCEDGTPDTFFQGKPGGFWAEFKQVTYKRLTSPIKPRWRAGQVGWAKEHQKHGGLWFLVIAINDKLMFTAHAAEEYSIIDFDLFNLDEVLKKIKEHYHG